ncbi:MAG: shikimate dehydrogenase [candidate division KSB1 bacterium]|nr:shikimate dehydrogenase [candidate division KSB1 bacterium]MDZ7365186.1 shikimate dehydrogenase [candidate division KSB1 bacterium]MDZ7404396.1 shikimate dehydrogenase [candidate division KSB1 bacterium]
MPSIQKLAVIGDPIAHSLSPVLQGFLIRHFALPFTYEALHLRANDLPKMMQRLRHGEFRGINVTIPHKQAVLSFLDEIDETAARLGAVNTIAVEANRLIGHNTDVTGFLRSFKAAGISLLGKIIFVLGAGGAARAVIFALLKSGAKKIFFCNRSAERANALITAFIHDNRLQNVQWPERLAWLQNNSIDVAINATSMGMHPQLDESPLPPAAFSPYMIAFDLIYNPLETAFLRAAAAAGAKTVNGLGMLIEQGVAALEIWSQRKFDIRDIHANLENELRQVLETS